ncbi:MAG: hypothetical protein ACI9UA_005416 [Pseudoalteromonas tetraodonis]|jgi:hypothetical protein
MKKLVLTILASVVLGALAYAGIFLWQKGRIDQAHQHETAFEWLSKEFVLTDEQSARIESLHKEYFPECEDHCIHYTDTRETLAKVTNDPGLDNSPEHKAAAERLTNLEKEADKRFIDFVYQVSAEMDQEQSKRYLQKMKGWLERAGEIGSR